jgi:hypothetical protein
MLSVTFTVIKQGETMTSTVRVNMNVCDHCTTVRATKKDEMTYEIEITSDCPNIMSMAEKIDTLSLTDLTDKPNSRLFDIARESEGSANCLVPAGILHAAWIEAGLISKNRALGVKTNNVEFVD